MPHAVFNSVLVTSQLIKYEHAPGTTFVAISRLPCLSCGLIMPMPFQRLQSISCGRNFLSRIQEQTRLQQLSDSQ